MHANLDCIDKRPPLPAVFVGGERQHAVVEPRELKRPGADAPFGVLPSAVDGERDEKSSPASKPGRLGIGESLVKTTDGPPRGPRSTGNLRAANEFSDATTCDRSERRAVVKMHAGPQPELPAMIVVVRFPLDGQRGCTVPARRSCVSPSSTRRRADSTRAAAIGSPSISTRNVPP